MTPETEPVPTPAPRQPVSAESVTTGALVIFTGIIIYLCYLVTQPFLPALAWALALAVIAHPVQRWMEGRIKSPSISAGLTVAAIILLLITPTALVTQSLVSEATQYAGVVQEGISSGRWEESLARNRVIGPLIRWVRPAKPETSNDETPDRGKESESQNDRSSDSREKPSGASEESASNDASSTPNEGNGETSAAANAAKGSSAERDPGAQDGGADRGSGNSGERSSAEGQDNRWSDSSGTLASAAGAVTSRVGTFLSGTVRIGMLLLITVMCLFFFLRDRRSVLNGVRSLLPLSETEADRILCRVNDTIHATIFGSLTVAFVQGCMGGLMFWLLGLPSPLFWGAVMGLLAVVPVLGTFVIWAPAAVYLAFQGETGKALILAGWGAVAIGLIDNLLYPFLVGNRMRFHTLLVFFSIVGGLTVFGAAGIVLGPVLLAVADGLLQIWHHRVARARQAS